MNLLRIQMISVLSSAKHLLVSIFIHVSLCLLKLHHLFLNFFMPGSKERRLIILHWVFLSGWSVKSLVNPGILSFIFDWLISSCIHRWCRILSLGWCHSLWWNVNWKPILTFLSSNSIRVLINTSKLNGLHIWPSTLRWSMLSEHRFLNLNTFINW